MRNTLLALSLLSLPLLAPAVSADAIEDAIKYRKGVYQAVKWHFGPIGAMVKGEKPFDAALAKRNAERLVLLAQMPAEAYIEGSNVGTTKAKAVIWEKRAEFDKAQKDFEMAAVALNTAAQSGDLAKIKPVFADMGKTCKACHDTFRD